MLRFFLVIFVIIHITQQQEQQQQQNDCRADYQVTICKNINFDKDLSKMITITTNRLVIEESFGNDLNIDNFQLDQVSKDRIVELILTNNNFTKIDTNLLCTTLKNLQQLLLINNRRLIKINHEQFENCDHLKQLHLDNVDIIDSDQLFSKLMNLEMLTITNSNLTNNFTLNNLKQLKSLTIRFTNIKDYLINNSEIFKQLANLQYLDLQHNQLNYLPINLWNNLEILDLSYNQFNNTIWQYLNTNSTTTSLKVLFFNHNNISDIIDIGELLMHHPQLERIFLSGRKFMAEKIKQIDNELSNINNKNNTQKLNLIWLDG